MCRKITTTEFIEKAELKHYKTYDYSVSNYISANSKIKILCPKHGIFEQVASSHLKGQGCKKCFLDTRRLTNDTIIEKCNLIHGNKYDYSLMNNHNIHVKVKIICPIHGEFEQRPNSHLVGKGCKKCSDSIKQNYKRLTLNEFKEKCNLKHQNKYDYSLITEVELEAKGEIICNIHGKFKQKLKNHLYQGNGCPRCKDSKGELEISKWLTINKLNFIQQKRFKDCRDKLPLPFDFYLPDHNICIEYDGEQHFKPVKRFGGLPNFLKVIKRDLIKTEFCDANDIELLRINYNENIDNYLNSILTTKVSGETLKSRLKSGEIPNL